MRWYICTLLAALLAACAWMVGPCSIQTTPERQAHCDKGGFMFFIPPHVLEAVTPSIDTQTIDVAPGMGSNKEKSRP